MGSAPTKFRKLAQRALSFEARSRKADDRSAAFWVIEKIRQRLSTLTGAAGFRAVLARALALAADEARWLNGVHVAANGSLEGLDEVCARLSADEVVRGEAIFVARLIELFVTFIGDLLTVQLLRDIWPEISPDEFDSGAEQHDG